MESTNWGSTRGQSPVIRTTTEAEYFRHASKYLFRTSRELPRKTGILFALQCAAKTSSVFSVVVATKTSSSVFAFLNREMSTSSRVFPASGFMTLPGRRVDPIRACTTAKTFPLTIFRFAMFLGRTTGPNLFFPSRSRILIRGMPPEFFLIRPLRLSR